VREGYYNGLTLHRGSHTTFFEGGSPAANYFTGATHLRDEVGFARATEGAIGLSRHDRHTGNMQFFIVRDDVPDYDRQFTFFGRLGACQTGPPADDLRRRAMIDALLIGSTIRTIEKVMR
jgi:cyclophilin family peptidyl-prolyl cis-trans isomerase